MKILCVREASPLYKPYQPHKVGGGRPLCRNLQALLIFALNATKRSHVPSPVQPHKLGFGTFLFTKNISSTQENTRRPLPHYRRHLDFTKNTKPKPPKNKINKNALSVCSGPPSRKHSFWTWIKPPTKTLKSLLYTHSSLPNFYSGEPLSRRIVPPQRSNHNGSSAPQPLPQLYPTAFLWAFQWTSPNPEFPSYYIYRPGAIPNLEEQHPLKKEHSAKNS